MLHCHFYMAVWLPLFGMNPCLLSEKESSYSSDNTCASAVCCVRSNSVDISSDLFSPLGFGIFSRLIGERLVSAASNGLCLLMWGGVELLAHVSGGIAVDACGALIGRHSSHGRGHVSTSSIASNVSIRFLMLLLSAMCHRLRYSFARDAIYVGLVAAGCPLFSAGHQRLMLLCLQFRSSMFHPPSLILNATMGPSDF